MFQGYKQKEKKKRNNHIEVPVCQLCTEELQEIICNAIPKTLKTLNANN